MAPPEVSLSATNLIAKSQSMKQNHALPPDGRPARIFGRQSRFRRVKNIVLKLSQLIDDLRGYVFIGEELHPPGTYAVTVVSRSIKAAE